MFKGSVRLWVSRALEKVRITSVVVCHLSARHGIFATSETSKFRVENLNARKMRKCEFLKQMEHVVS